MSSLLVRTGVASGENVSVIRLADRRDGTIEKDWVFQREVEAALYGHGFGQQNGAVYQLLRRSGVSSQSLPLKKASTAKGLVTEDEFDWLHQHLGNVRSFTLIPLSALGTALSTFGRCSRSEALVGTESIDEVLDADGDDDAHEASPAAPAEPMQSYSGNTAERQHTGFYISPVLEAQLAAFDVHRSAPINQHRKGASVTKTTRQSDRGRICRYLKWLAVTYALKTSPTLNVFLHASIAAAAQRYIKEMIEQHQRKYSYASAIAASLVAVASFAATRRQVGRPVNGVLAQLQALHLQCRKLARRDDKFEVAEKPASWLDWDAVQRVRCAAEEALAASESEKERLKLTRDVTILRFLADQPPDRVGVTRALQLGGTLKRVDGGYQLDLSEGSHKTAAVFGATRTSISPTVSPWLDDYISLADIPEGGFLFHPRDDKLHALSPSMWTKLVKGLFARHGDVALCPKDARSSFITFLRSGDHDDEVTRAAAVAMRHSSKMQASSAYDKGSCDRRVSAAMKVAADYSAKFKATGPV